MTTNAYLNDIYIDCGKCTREFVSAVCDAWDDTVREFERDMGSLIGRKSLRYNFAERIQFALQIKGNPIERQCASLAQEWADLLKSKLDVFEQLVIKLTLEYKDEWLCKGVHKERMLRIEDPQMHQTLVEYLTKNLKLAHGAKALEFDDPLCEMIAHYVFFSEYPLQADLILKEVTEVGFEIPSVLFLYLPHKTDYLEMFKIKPEEVIASAGKKLLEALITHGGEYVHSACYRYRDRAESTRDLIQKRAHIPLDDEM